MGDARMNDRTRLVGASRVHRIRMSLVGVLFVGGVGFIVASRGEDDLRAAARVVDKWDDRKATLRMPKPEEVAALPHEPRALFVSWQNKEGGDTQGVINDYAWQAKWLRELAEERAVRRELGIGLVALSLVGFAIALWLEKTERRRAAVFE